MIGAAVWCVQECVFSEHGMMLGSEASVNVTPAMAVAAPVLEQARQHVLFVVRLGDE